MKYGKNGIHLTESFEKCKLTAYKDSGGVWTNGWGNTHGVIPGTTITQEQADADLLANLQNAVNAVNKLVTVQLTQEEFDALVDFVFNAGVGAFSRSTLLQFINAHNFQAAMQEIEKWDKVKGDDCLGLLRRRLAEEALFREDI